MADNQNDDPEQDGTGTGAQPDPAASEPQEPQNPWGDDFDADKAWKLVQHLREENKDLKDKNRAYEDEKLSEREKADRDLAETKAELDRLRLAKTLAEIRAKHPSLSEEDMEFLGSGSPEELEAKAAKLAARLKPAAPDGPEHLNPLRRQPTGGIDPTGNGRPRDFIREALRAAQH
ncbi:hypothetical protein [Bifidobacterium castoris]|uniref:Scaffolding protein n=1 Tax=Bifidobacterium castoris TaxID=2306972 RepID=A0A430F599_9BIFI|nr:hypothetical protein [Bifidobacterium castoris]RSX46113.1 hypothetical protein D2E22_1685 [Bifidobacterium castoris]